MKLKSFGAPLGLRWLAAAVLLLAASASWAHGVAGGDAQYLESVRGLAVFPLLYLGAKHMVTGYDHLLFLFGVIFFLYRMKDIGVYVTMFALGHSATLLFGVLANVSVNAYLIDAVIGLSVVYKALDNLGAYQRWFGVQPDTKAMTLVFGLFHGFGLATKLQDLELNPNGLVENLVAFNIGVEIGQLIALSLILAVMTVWRTTTSFPRFAVAANALLFLAGVVLAGQQLAGFFIVGDG